MSVTNAEISHQSSAQLSEFNAELSGLFKTNNPEARSLLGYIRRLLIQFRLNGRYSECDILATAYLRGVEQLRYGQTIRNPKAWLRKTVLNVIRERTRQDQREYLRSVDIEDSFIADESIGSLLDDLIPDENQRAIKKAFHQLSNSEQRLLSLKYLQGMTWKEVQAHLGETDMSLSTVRKRGQRTLAKLRSEYHAIKEAST